MAEDRRAKPEAGPGAPKRSSTRTAPVIDAKATDVTPVEPETSAAEGTPAGLAPDAVPEAAAAGPGAEAGVEAKPAADGDGAPPPAEDKGEPEPSAAEPAAAPAAPAPPARPGRGLAGAALLVSLVALAAAGATGWRVLNPPDTAAPLAARLDRMEHEVAALENRSKAVADLERRLQALEAGSKTASAQFDQLKADVTRAVNSADAARLATAEPAQHANAPAATADVAHLESQVASLEQRVQAGRNLGNRLDALQKRIGSLDQQIAAQGKSLDSLAARPTLDVAATEKATKTAVSTADTAARVVVAENLVRAVEAGKPFSQQFAALSATGATAPDLAALQASAKTGVPTAAQLAAEFRPLAGPILAGTKPSAKGSLWDRLASSAGELVKIRPVGSATGTGTTALVARIEAALARGDVAAALAERDKLPEAARQRTADWAARAKSRVEAVTAANAILSDATARLARPRS